VFIYNELLIISALVETYIYLLYEVYGQSPPNQETFEKREISGVFITLLYLKFHLCNTFNKNVGNGNILSTTVQILHKTHYNLSLYRSNRFTTDHKR